MKLCKDCRWIEWPDNNLERRSYEATCRHDTSKQLSRPDLVLGTTPPATQLSCRVAREFSINELCGPEGRYWELSR